MTEKQPQIVVIHRFENGDMDFLICGDDGVRVFVVDEGAPNDRVYEMSGRCHPDEIKEVLGTDPIGSQFDERHAAIKHTIEAAMECRPRLVSVSNDTEEK